MRTVSDDMPVRLYHLDEDGWSATTILYGTLAQALAAAAEQPDEIQSGLFLQTCNDVVSFLDLVQG